MNKKQRSIDSKLVLDYQSGDYKALAVLVKRWHKIFCEKAFWIVKDADVAKDIAQDSWSTIMTQLNKLKDPNSFRSWALRIVYNKSLDVVKATQRTQKTIDAYKKEQDKVYVDEACNNEQLKAMLLKTIKTLAEHQQIVIRLFYVENYSLKEISKTLNISVGTAKSRLFHAREKLKETLEPMLGN